MSESTTEVSGGGAISGRPMDPLDQGREYLVQQATMGSSHPLSAYGRAVIDRLCIALEETRAALDASEARAEAAERQWEKYKAEAHLLNRERDAAESRLAAADAVVEAATEILRPARGDADWLHTAEFDKLRRALDAYDSQPQPTPSPEEE